MIDEDFFKWHVRQPFVYDAEEASDSSGTACEDESLAVQSQAIEADINTIVKRFGLTGELPEGLKAPSFADFEDVFDFQTAQNAIVAANATFMELPAEVRARFNHNPQMFLEFCTATDGKVLTNLEEMRKLGLAVGGEEKESGRVDPNVGDEAKASGG